MYTHALAHTLCLSHSHTLAGVKEDQRGSDVASLPFRRRGNHILRKQTLTDLPPFSYLYLSAPLLHLSVSLSASSPGLISFVSLFSLSAQLCCLSCRLSSFATFFLISASSFLSIPSFVVSFLVYAGGVLRGEVCSKAVHHRLWSNNSF